MSKAQTDRKLPQAHFQPYMQQFIQMQIFKI